MSTKNDYDKDEWHLLTSLPSMVGAAMAGAGRSGLLGTLQEASASFSCLLSAAEEHPENELICALVAKAESLSEAREQASEFREQATAELRDKKVEGPDDLAAVALGDCRAAAKLLAKKSTPAEALEYKEWILSVGERVATAAKEGGFLGFGGERVDIHEERLLVDIRSALGLDPSPS